MQRPALRPFVSAGSGSSYQLPAELLAFLDAIDGRGFVKSDGAGGFTVEEIDRTGGAITGSLGEIGDAVTLDWTYSDEARDFELFSPLFVWRDIAPIAVKEAIAGDESLDLATTEGLKLGEPYVLVAADGALIETIELSRVLTAKRIRARLPVGTNIAEADGAFLARTSAEIRERSAVFSDGDVLYSSVLDALRVQDDGRLFLRRTSDGTGTFKIEYRDADDDLPWVTAPLIEVRTRLADTRDEEYRIGLGGLIKLRITYAGATAEDTETVRHFVLGPSPRADAADFVEQPRNVSPADQAINVGETPTLTWSAYKSLYDEAQGGAHVRIARDPEMSDLVLSTSNDWLASWVAVPGFTEDWTAVVARDVDSFTAVASGVSVVLDQEGTVTETHTVAGDLRAVDADTGLTVAAGAAGAIRTLADGETDYVNRAAGGGYTGTFAGVAVRGSRVCLVGTGAEIQFASNGTIFGKVVPDGGFDGDFTDVCADGTGRVAAVGANGAIQTSANDGESNWMAREAPGGYTGTYRAVAMLPTGRGFAVGDDAALHETFDGGATWADGNPADGFGGAFLAIAIVNVGGTIYAVVTGAGGEIQTRNLSEDNSQWQRRPTGAGAADPIRAVALDPNGDALALGDGGLAQRTFRLNGVISSFTVPAGILETGAIYFWDTALADVRDRWSPFSVPTAFATGATFQYIAQPQNIAPAPGDDRVSVQPTLQTSAFRAVGGADNHVASRYWIYEDAAGSVLAYDSGEVADLLAHQVPAGSLLDPEQSYWFQASHIGETFGMSARSTLTSFATIARPNKPAITAPSNGATDVAIAPTITTSAFSMPGGGSHDASRYQVSTSASFTSLVYDSGWIADLTSHALPDGSLGFSTAYYLRAYHRESGGQISQASNAVQITTVEEPVIQDLFATTLYTGSGSQRSILSGVDMTSAAGMTWITRRDGGDHFVFDTVRGALNRLKTNTQDAGANLASSLTAFQAGGFDLGSAADVNANGSNFVAWSFLSNPRFFNIVTYEGDGVHGRAIPHGLNGKPGLVIVKNRENSADWFALQRYPDPPPSQLPALNRGSPDNGNRRVFNYQMADAANFYVGYEGNTQLTDYVAYVFADDTGDNGMIRSGIFRGNSSGLEVNLGWRPQWILVKGSSRNYSQDWVILDAERGLDGGAEELIYANQQIRRTQNAIETTPTGFSVQSNSSGLWDVNASGSGVVEDYFYIAIRAVGA